MLFSHLLYLTGVGLSGYSCGVVLHKLKSNSYKLETVSATNLRDKEKLANSWISAIGHPRDEQHVENATYAVRYDYETMIPRWASERVTKEAIDATGCIEEGPYNTDFRIHPLFRSTLEDYPQSNLPEGAANKVEPSVLASPLNFNAKRKTASEAFALSNVAPQYCYFKQGMWKTMERSVRSVNACGPIYIVSGPLFLPNCTERKKRYSIVYMNSEKNVPIPTHFFKLVMYTDACTNANMYKCFVGENSYPDHADPQIHEFHLDKLARTSGLVVEYPERPEF